jgi:phosphomannomutase
MTRAELHALLDADDIAELTERFASRLEFGTAGIRGGLGGGPGRMNRALVRGVTAGLASYLLQVVPDAAERGVVVGRDRRHMSKEFAQDTAAVLAAAGIPVHVFSDVVPTPVLAYAVTALQASGGIMITASHNPPQDNGYKVYWGNGAQIIPPHDSGISRAVDAVGSIRSIPLLGENEARSQELLRDVPDSVGEEYLQSILDHRRHPELPTGLKIVYTPLHGVGGRWVEEALRRARFRDLMVVALQAEPDPDFPTVQFPNPEEPGAMDLALALAEREDADLVLANDPDADRLAVIARTRQGDYRRLTGNEIGLALGDYLLTENPRATDPVVMTTVVSSMMVRKMAAEIGVHYAETLTGYKWIANKAIELKSEQGYEFVFGFEEALGYTVGELVRDKDGIGAAVTFADLATFCRTKNQTVLDWVEDIYRRFGLHASGAKSVTLSGSEGAAAIRTIMDGLRSSPPDSVGGTLVAARGDIETGIRVDLESGQETALDFPKSNVLVFELADRSRVLVRPSGTEPKIKYYFEVVEKMEDEEEFLLVEARAKARLEALMDAFLKIV